MRNTFCSLIAFLAFLPLPSRGSEDAAKMLKVPAAVDRAADGISAQSPASGGQPASPAKSEGNASAADKNATDASDKENAEAVVSDPFPVSRYAQLWEKSPFQLESIAPPPQSEALGQRFALGGILRLNGEPVVWVRERATQQSFQVSMNSTNKMGLSLVDVREVMTNQSAATATIRAGNEQGEIKFDAASAPAPGMAAPPPIYRPPTPPTPASMPPGLPAGAAAQVPSMPATQPVAGSPVMQPGIVPPVPGPAAPGQVQPPGAQEQMPPPRVIRRRAIVPAAP